MILDVKCFLLLENGGETRESRLERGLWWEEQRGRQREHSLLLFIYLL